MRSPGNNSRLRVLRRRRTDEALDARVDLAGAKTPRALHESGPAGTVESLDGEGQSLPPRRSHALLRLACGQVEMKRRASVLGWARESAGVSERGASALSSYLGCSLPANRR